MELLSISNNKFERIVLNLLIILIFVIINPIYALFLCGFLNFASSRINFFIFSFMFTLSFSLLFFLNDYNLTTNHIINADLNFYILSFQEIDKLSWYGIILRFILLPNGNEFLYWFYVKIANILFFGNADIFVFFHRFITFLLIAYLGKLIHSRKYVIVIVCILFLSYHIFNNVFQIWRQNTAFLIFFIGLFSFDTKEIKWFPRIIIYCSAFIHITMIIPIIFFEFFILFNKGSNKLKISKLYSKGMAGYLAVSVSIFLIAEENFIYFILQPFGLAQNMSVYFQVLNPGIPYSSVLFNWLTYLILLSLWLKRKNLAYADVFIFTQYFIFIVLISELILPDVFSRYSQYAVIGGTLLIGKMGAANYRFGLPLLVFLNINFYWNVHFNPAFYIPLSNQLYSGYKDPVYGLGNMILNYGNILNFNF